MDFLKINLQIYPRYFIYHISLIPQIFFFVYFILQINSFTHDDDNNDAIYARRKIRSISRYPPALEFLVAFSCDKELDRSFPPDSMCRYCRKLIHTALVRCRIYSHMRRAEELRICAISFEHHSHLHVVIRIKHPVYL